MIHVMFDTFSVVSFFCIGKFYFEGIFLNCHSELFGENSMKMITKGQICLLNYKLATFSI
jgi:hypothetical protein